MKKEFTMFHLLGFAKNICVVKCLHELETTITCTPQKIFIKSIHLMTEENIKKIQGLSNCLIEEKHYYDGVCTTSGCSILTYSVNKMSVRELNNSEIQKVIKEQNLDISHIKNDMKWVEINVESY